MRTSERPTIIDVPVVEAAPQPEAPPQVDVRTTPASKWSWLLTPVLAFVIFAVSMFLNSYRISETADLKSDEATYVIESVSFYRTGMTMWDGNPFFIHPPIFYMIEGMYFKALGIGQSPLFDRLVYQPYTAGQPLLAADVPLNDDNVFNAIQAGRRLSALYGAIGAVLLFLFGRYLLNLRLGIAAAALFTLDPYVLWRHHFNYIEPLAGIFLIATMFTYYSALRQWSYKGRRTQLLLAGFLFGLAMLTKELSVVLLPAFFVHALFFRRVRLTELIRPGLLAGALYSLFPLWATLNGYFDGWWRQKTWLSRRITGSIQDTGITRPGASPAKSLSPNLFDYWPWLLVLGIVAALVALFVALYFWRNLRDRPAELLASFVIGSYAFFVVVWRIGGVINEHFFYFLMPQVIMTLAYAVVAWPRLASHLAARRARDVAARSAWKESAGGKLRFGRGGMPKPRLDPSATVQLAIIKVGQGNLLRNALIGILVVVTSYNVGAWIVRYGLGTDNSYAQIEGKLVNKLPPGTAIVGRDLLDLYLLPKNAVYTYSYLNFVGRTIEPANIIDRRIPYALLNEQSVSEGYGGATGAYSKWVKANGTEIAAYRGRLWGTFAYSIDYSSPSLETLNTDSIAVGRPATASSTENYRTSGPGFAARFDASNAFDGKATTRWSSQESDTEWLEVDLGQSQTFSRVTIAWETASAKSYEIQISDDNVKWRTIYQTNKGIGGSEDIKVGGKARYVRLYMTKRATRFGYSIYEFSIFR